MKRIDTALPGLFLIEPKVFGDDRGFFYESYSATVFAVLGIDAVFVQDNHSKSARGVLRGLHFQRGAQAQDKLVRVTAGRAFDAVVDLRRSSPTFGQVATFVLSPADKRLLFVPRGFAHGFLALEDGTEFLYKCSAPYHPPSEGGVRFDDPRLAIPWPLDGLTPQLSARDRAWPLLADLKNEELFA